MATQEEVNATACWLRDATHVLIVAGAGMSAGCGVDYTSQDQFSELYPGLVQYGFATSYDCVMLVGSREPERLMWGYLSHHINNMRFKPTSSVAYDALRRLVGDRDHFVLTSNVDGMFERSGFDPSRVYTPQGDYKNLQCATPCSGVVVDAGPLMERLREPDAFDEETFMIRDGIPLPACPNCGGPMCANVRGNAQFNPAPYDATAQRFLDWIKEVVATPKSRLFVVEVGAGFNTPTVTRFPGESIARAHPCSSFVRINPMSGAVPRDMDRAASLPMTGIEAFERLIEAPADELTAAAESVEGKRRQATATALAQRRPAEMWEKFRQLYRHFDYEVFVNQLRR